MKDSKGIKGNIVIKIHEKISMNRSIFHLKNYIQYFPLQFFQLQTIGQDM